MPVSSVADLERELQVHRRAEYRRLQDAALVKLYTERVGHPPADRAAILAQFPGQLVPTIDPTEYLSDAEIAATLASKATASNS